MSIVRAPRRTQRIAGLAVGAVLLVGFAWYLISFVLAPNIATVASVIGGDPASVIGDLAASDRVMLAIRDTVLLALASTITVNIVGIAQVLLLEAVHIPGRRFLTVAFAIPLVFGSVAAVTGYVLVYGERGMLTTFVRSIFPALPADWFNGWVAVLIVHTFTMTGFHFLFLRPAIRRVDFSMVEAARSLGMPTLRALRAVVLPAVRPVLVSCLVLVFISAVTSFAAPQLLGVTTVAPLIQALLGLGRTDMAAVLGVFLGIVTIAMLAWALVQDRRMSALSGGKSARPFERIRIRSRAVRVLLTAVAWLFAAINIAPLAVTALLSFAPIEAIRRGELSLALTVEHYVTMVSDADAAQPLLNSFMLAALAVPFALLVSWIAAHLAHRLPQRFGDGVQLVAFVPHFLPGVLIALGLILAFGDRNPLVGGAVLVGSFWILPIAYTVMMLPTMTRLLRSTYAGLDPAQSEAARSLGAGPIRTFLVAVLPVLLPVVVQVAALSVNDVLAEYTVSVMLYNVNNQPLGVTLGALAAARDPEYAGLTGAYVVTITALSLVLMVVADRFAERASARQLGVA